MIAYIVHIPLIFLLAWWLYRRHSGAPLRAVFWVGWSVKLLAGIVLGVIYTHYYTYQSDSFVFFQDAVALSRLARHHPTDYLRVLFTHAPAPDTLRALVPELVLYQQPRAFFMAKLVSVVALVSFQNYWITGTYLSLFSFYGAWRLANTLAVRYPAFKTAAGIAFLFFPSAVFWSAGVMKESIAVGCVYWLVHLLLVRVFRLKNRMSVGEWMGILMAVYVLWQLKFYYAGVLLPVGAAYWLAVYIAERGRWLKTPLTAAAGMLVFLIMLLVSATWIHPTLRMDRFLASVVENHDSTVRISSPGNLVHFRALRPDLAHVLPNVPQALVAGLFRPLFWEARTFFQWIVALENTALLALFIYALLRLRTYSFTSPVDYLLLLAAILYIALLATLLALASPNLGTLARYKAGFLSVWVYLLLLPVAQRIRQSAKGTR